VTPVAPGIQPERTAGYIRCVEIRGRRPVLRDALEDEDRQMPASGMISDGRSEPDSRPTLDESLRGARVAGCTRPWEFECTFRSPAGCAMFADGSEMGDSVVSINSWSLPGGNPPQPKSMDQYTGWSFREAQGRRGSLGRHVERPIPDS